MRKLSSDSIVSTLRALHWHIERLANTDENVRDELDLTNSKVAREQLVAELKLRAFIK